MSEKPDSYFWLGEVLSLSMLRQPNELWYMTLTGEFPDDSGNSKVTLAFQDVIDLHITHFTQLDLVITNVRDHQWEGVCFRVYDEKGDMSFYCGSWELVKKEPLEEN